MAARCTAYTDLIQNLLRVGACLAVRDERLCTDHISFTGYSRGSLHRKETQLHHLQAPGNKSFCKVSVHP